MEPKERVLVLTASAEDLRQIEGLLSPEGIEVVPARGLAEALEQQAP